MQQEQMQQKLTHILLKTDLANLKSDLDKSDIDKLKNVDKLDINKLVPVSVDLSKLSAVVKMMLFKKDVYNAKLKNIEDKISNITNLATNTFLPAKINEVKVKCLVLLT